MDAYELIEKKIDGELSPEEEERFAERLRDEPDFARRYQLYQEAIAGLREHYKQSLRHELETHASPAPLAEALEPTRPTARVGLLGYWPIAVAAALMAIALGIGWFWPLSSASPEKVAEQFYTVYPGEAIVRGANEAIARDSAQLLYQQQRYAAAIPYWQQLAPTEDHAQVALWLGHCYWQTKQLSSALESFRTASQSDDAIVRQHGTWYLALTYLRRGDTEAALPLLRRMQQEGSIYQREVEELLTKVE